MKITINPKEDQHPIIKRNGIFYYPFVVDIEFDDGTKITTDVKTSRCAQLLCSGNYEVSGVGDVDGTENTCSKCGTKVWGPVYIDLEKRWKK